MSHLVPTMYGRFKGIPCIFTADMMEYQVNDFCKHFGLKFTYTAANYIGAYVIFSKDPDIFNLLKGNEYEFSASR